LECQAISIASELQTQGGSVFLQDEKIKQRPAFLTTNFFETGCPTTCEGRNNNYMQNAFISLLSKGTQFFQMQEKLSFTVNQYLSSHY